VLDTQQMSPNTGNKTEAAEKKQDQPSQNNHPVGQDALQKLARSYSARKSN
jgi:hypothetical protein